MSAQNNNGITELMIAASRGERARVEGLLRAGADININARDAFGPTALRYAAGGGHLAAVEALAGGGADIRARKGNRKSGSDLTKDKGHVASALLRRGAYADARNADGTTAPVVAERKGLAEIEQLLRDGPAERPPSPLVAPGVPALTDGATDLGASLRDA